MKFLPWQEPTYFRYLSSQVVMGTVGTLSKLALRRHTVQIINYDLLEKYVLHRTDPVITVSNHLSTLDDPLLLGILPFWAYVRPETMRFVPSAQELTFEVNSYFFNSGQLVPVVRGQGIWQRGMDFCIDKINRDDAWIQIYPEGKVNQDITKCIRWKWGIARILMEAKKRPHVIPFAHSGMQHLMPLHPTTRENLNTIPSSGGHIKIAFGEPIPLDDILSKCKDAKDPKSRSLLTAHLQDAFEAFRRQHNLNE